MINNLGIPYMGSKRKLAPKIIAKILEQNPSCKYIYDLFGGGASISLCAIQYPQIKGVFYNELNTGIVELLRDVITHGVTDKYYQWIDRDTFNQHKDDDTWFGGLCKCIWSFGNNQKGYLYGKDIEEYKRLYHMLTVDKIDTTVEMSKIAREIIKVKYNLDVEVNLTCPAMNDKTERRLNIGKQFNDLIGEKSPRQLQQLERLEQLQQLEQLQHLQQLDLFGNPYDKLTILNKSYDEVNITTPLDETVIYLDPPYQGTHKYAKDICHNALLDYIKQAQCPIYISGYDMPLEDVLEMKHRSTLSPTSNNAVIEKLYRN